MIQSRHSKAPTTLGYRALLNVAALFLALSSPAIGQAPPSTQVGVLWCNIAPSVGFIVGGRQTMTCRFTPSGAQPPQDYTGVINTVGLDVGGKGGGVMSWAVIAPIQGTPAGGLAPTRKNSVGPEPC
jgi:hypothetical protein